MIFILRRCRRRRRCRHRRCHFTRLTRSLSLSLYLLFLERPEEHRGGEAEEQEKVQHGEHVQLHRR